MNDQEKKDLPISKFSEWGKLGGRPIKNYKMSKVISFRLTPKEFAEIEVKAKNKKMIIAEYCRVILNEREIPNVEQNKTLIKYANNFSKIKNYMQMGIFNESEKKRQIDEIEVLISEMRSLIKWL